MSTLRKLCICAAFVATACVATQPGEVTYVSGQPQAVKVTHATVTTTTYPVEVISPTILTSYIDSQPLVEAAPLRRWGTEAHDSTATWPDASDATRQLPMAVQVKFACIRYQESRNHLAAREIHSGAGGWYQFIPYIWDYARGYIPGLPASAAAATGDQQSKVAVWYYKRNNGFMPEWAADQDVCSL